MQNSVRRVLGRGAASWRSFIKLEYLTGEASRQVWGETLAPIQPWVISNSAYLEEVGWDFMNELRRGVGRRHLARAVHV